MDAVNGTGLAISWIFNGSTTAAILHAMSYSVKQQGLLASSSIVLLFVHSSCKLLPPIYRDMTTVRNIDSCSWPAHWRPMSLIESPFWTSTTCDWVSSKVWIDKLWNFSLLIFKRKYFEMIRFLDIWKRWNLKYKIRSRRKYLFFF